LAIDNIFIDETRINLYDVIPIINGFSDHNVHYPTLKNVFISNKNSNTASRKRFITTNSLSNFIEIMKNESWEEIFSQSDVNKNFNSFLNSLLIHTESCFQMQ
jgi:hypothetical protein